MTASYWLADSESRVLGPVTLDVIRDLSLRGKLGDVRGVSRDGKNFVPLRDVAEVQGILVAPKGGEEVVRAQADAVRQIREWLDSVRGRTTAEVFRVPENGSREAYRAAFFGLVYRYVPGRLPASATPELRLACEDAFLFLAERMVEVEQHLKKSRPTPPMTPLGPPPPAEVSWRGGMIHVRLSLAKGDARPFTMDAENTWKSDCLFVVSNERLMVSTPGEVTIAFEGHVTQIHSAARIVGVKQLPVAGFALKLLDLSEQQRAMVRTWVQRAA